MHFRPWHPSYFHPVLRLQHIRQMTPIIAAMQRMPERLPAITIKALVELGPKADEGTIVLGVAPAWFEFVRLIGEDPEAIYRAPPREMEELVAGGYHRAGIFDEVILTPRSGDGGKDVIATAIIKNLVTVRILDQVKAYKPGHLVTADEVRSMIGTLDYYPDASIGVITTTSDFAPKVPDHFKKCIPSRLLLRTRDDLLAMLDEVSKSTQNK